MNTFASTGWFIMMSFNMYFGFSQSLDDPFVIPDSLKKQSYNEIYNSFVNYHKDTLVARILLKSCMQKARLEQDNLKMAKIYAAYYFYEKDDSLKIRFLDKSIQLTKNLKHNFYPAFPYSSKGNFYLGKWDYEKSLDNYLKALEFSEKNNNKGFQHITEYNIGIIKSKLGKHDEALEIFIKSKMYNEKRRIRDTIDYMDNMVYLTESYTLNNKIDSSDYYIDKTLSTFGHYSKKLRYQLLLNKGINFYHKNKPEFAQKTIVSVLPYLEKMDDKSFMVKAYFYLGKNRESGVITEEVLRYYKKVDSVFDYTKFVIPEVRDSYLYLIHVYSKRKDFENQLYYVNRLLSFDSIMHKNNSQVNEKLIKNYDTVKLLAEKEKLIEFINDKNTSFKLYIGLLAGITLLLTILFYYQFRKRKLYLKRFNSLMETKKIKIPQKKHVSENMDSKALEIRKLKISEEIKENILAKIEDFEKNKEFLKPNITTNSLALQFKTNSKYVSRIVNIYKEKNFTNYINDLRIEYLIQELKTNKKFKYYTIKAISSEIGFNTTEAFSKYFYKKTGLYPSYFIKKITDYTDSI